MTGASGTAIGLRWGSEIVCSARAGRTAPDLGTRLQVDRGLSGECVRTGQILRCDNTETDSFVDKESCRWLGVRSLLVAPLHHFRRSLGIFEVLSAAPNAFNQNDVSTMQLLSSMMVAAITRLSRRAPSSIRT